MNTTKRMLGLMFSDKKTPIVLALSGSLRSPSFTDKILDNLIKGMGEVEVHKFYPHKMKIGPCTSCWSCWQGKNKGECAQKLSLIHISEPTRRTPISYAVFCLKKKNK